MYSWKSFDNVMVFTLYTSVSDAYVPLVLDFIYDTYVLPLGNRIMRVEKVRDFIGEGLRFTISLENGFIHVEVRAFKILEFTISWEGLIDKSLIDRVKEDLIIAVRMFEDNFRRSSIFFTFVENSSPIPERFKAKTRVIERIFTDSMILFFVVFLAINMVIFALSPFYAPIIIVLFQFCILLCSHKIIMKLGDWRITDVSQNVTVVQYHLFPDEYRTVLDMIRVKGRDWLYQIKREIFERTLAQSRGLDPNVIGDVLQRNGIFFRPEDLQIKTINVYRLVKEASEEFNLPMPRVVISNTIIPNAAASGVGPSFGVVMITAGLLTALEEGEVYAVVNHELSHLKGRDPVILFALSAFEYLFRLYVLLPIAPALFFIPFLYFFFIMSAIFFIGKFLEAKSDLEAAVKTRQPQLLAESLRKIGYNRLRLERSPGFKFESWLGWDPHPPISFRINRLENLKDLDNIKHPLLKSISDVVKGFIRSF
ncbi:M48 family metalloprotease [Candidatus Bathyarchaeota archaeon]|nr:M48 family metalloprotease [Candidatus Bathyarchaeota archaeon]MBS7613388.1 M48 family metalloprotease [Candidatus Bathyarchaeota archaeon]MBS7617120.1 M48 family metalloprotease [Candidatus Bathyarchaeota archaeon]